jgi:D-alanine transaminase
MSRVAYVNGAYVSANAAMVSAQDRGFQFGDAVYEVWAIRGGRWFDADAHMARLRRSLGELRIDMPTSEAALWSILRETQRRNRVRDGLAYVQISRGAGPRDHAFPAGKVRPTIAIFVKPLDPGALKARADKGVKVISLPENRWARRDVKSVNLLPNVLARQTARERGAFEAWFVDDDGFVTEGTSSTAWIVDAAGNLRTRPLTCDLLHGVTRAALMRIAEERQMKVVEKPFSVAEAQAAKEAFISGASNPAVPVVAIDDVAVGDGRPGPVTQALHAAYLGAASAA